MAAQLLLALGGEEIIAEQAGEGRPVRHVEHRQRRDMPMQLQRGQPAAEQPGGAAALIDLVQEPDRRDILPRHIAIALHVARVMDVLDHHQPHEIAVLGVVVKGELRQPPQRLHRVQAGQFQLVLGAAHPRIGLLQHRAVEPLLVAEVIVDHPFRGLGARRDLVDLRTGEPVGHKGLARHFEDIGAHRLGVLFPVAPRRAVTIRSGLAFLHADILHQMFSNQNLRPLRRETSAIRASTGPVSASAAPGDPSSNTRQAVAMTF